MREYHIYKDKLALSHLFSKEREGVGNPWREKGNSMQRNKERDLENAKWIYVNGCVS